MTEYEMNIKILFSDTTSEFIVDFGKSCLIFSGLDTEREIAERIGWEMLDYIRNMEIK